MTCAGVTAALAAWAEDFPGFVGWTMSARGKVLCCYEEQTHFRDPSKSVVFREPKRDKDGLPQRRGRGSVKARLLVAGVWPVPLDEVRVGPDYMGAYRPRDFLPVERFPDLLVQRDYWLGAR